MSWSKKAAVNYHFIESANEDFFTDFHNSLGAILGSENASGEFDAGNSHFFWTINGCENIGDKDAYFVSLVKEREAWPVWFSEEGGISAVPLEHGSLGELYYALISPAGKFILSMAASSGSPGSSFKKFLNEFSTDGGVKIIPLFEDKIDIKTLSWDFYKKLSASINFPTHDELAEFNTTKEGGLLGIIDELGGLKADVTVSAPKQKQTLNAAQIREMAKALLINDFCGKLVLRGADYETETLEEYDLKNAQIKYNEFVEISGSYMSESEALAVLKRAFAERAKELLNLP